MKKILFVLLLAPILSFGQGNPLNSMFGSSETYKNVETKTIILGTSTKTLTQGKGNRVLLPVTLPKGTTQWYYRITILKKNSPYKYDEKTNYFTLLSNNETVHLYMPLKAGIDFYVFHNKKNTKTFLKNFNQKFPFIKGCSYENVKSFTGTCKSIEQPLWIGLRNPNPARTLKIILEIVAYGKF